MYNKKTLSKAVSKLDKTKKPAQARDIIYDPAGQWKFPGQPTRIPGNDITMQNVPYPVMAYPNVGQPMLMQPGGEYDFPNADYVDEYPQMKKGGLKKNKTSRSLMATNKLFAKHAFFKKPKKNVIFDPNSPNFQKGGFIETELTEDEIQEYKDGGYIVEDISIPTLEYQKGGTSNDDPWKKIVRTTQKKIIDSNKVKPDTSNWRRANDDAPNLNYQNTKQNTTVKKLSPEDKKSQENFDKNFKVEGKDNYTKYKDKVQENLKLWSGDRANYADYDDNEWESAVEDLTTNEMNNAFDNSIRQELVDNRDGLGKKVETLLPDNQIAWKFDKNAPKETNAQYRQSQQDWDKKNILEKLYIEQLGYPLGLVDRANPYDESTPIVASTPRIAEDIAGIGRNKMFVKGAQYLMPKIKQAANYFLKEEGGSIPYLQDGGIYTYAGRKDSKYKKDDKGNWLISNASTGNKFTPIKDPTGERTAQLNKKATLNPDITTPVKQFSESTDTQGIKALNKQFAKDKLDTASNTVSNQQDLIDQYRASILKNKPFGKDTAKNKAYHKDKLDSISNRLYSDRDNLLQEATVNLRMSDKDKVKALPKGSVKTGPSTYDILTNPFDAFKYSVMTGDVSNMPANYNKFKRAGINPLDGQGGNLIGDQLNNLLNPVDIADKVYYNTKQGDGWSAALHAARALPMLQSLSKTSQGAKVLAGLDKNIVSPLNKVLNTPNARLVDATGHSSPFVQKLVDNATIGNVLKGRATVRAVSQTPALYDKAIQVKNDIASGDFNKENALNFLEQAGDVGLQLIPYTKIPSWSRRANNLLDQSTNPYWFSKAYWGAANPNKPIIGNKSPLLEGKVFDAITLLKTLPTGKKLGGEPEALETELTDKEIKQLKKQGYVIELI
jgi:hypothetical protein